jgi:hypothetical protein
MGATDVWRCASFINSSRSDIWCAPCLRQSPLGLIRGKVRNFNNAMGNGALPSAVVSSSRRLRWGVVPPGFLYSPFTAADEKIPLSMGQVNCKPQYLVFSSHLLDELTKHGDSRCGKRKFPSPVRLFSLRTARNLVQIALRRPSDTPTSLCSAEYEAQGMETVQIRCEIVRIRGHFWAHRRVI